MNVLSTTHKSSPLIGNPRTPRLLQVLNTPVRHVALHLLLFGSVIATVRLGPTSSASAQLQQLAFAGALGLIAAQSIMSGQWIKLSRVSIAYTAAIVGTTAANYSLVTSVMGLLGILVSILVVSAAMSHGFVNMFRNHLLFWCIMNLVSAPLFGSRAFNDLGRFAGLHASPNMLGWLSMMYLMFVIAESRELRNIRNLDRLLVGPVGLMLIATGSRSSVMALVLGLAVLAAQTRSLPFSWRAYSLGSAVVLVVVLLSPSIVADSITRLTNLGLESDQLNGREEVWTASLTLAEERPLMGVGYARGGEALGDYALSSGANFRERTSHNAFLHTLVEVGAIGLVAYISLWSRALLNAARCKHSLGVLLPSGLLVSAMFESSAAQATTIQVALLFALAAHPRWRLVAT